MNSVEQFVKKQLINLQLPLNQGTLEVWHVPPIVENYTNPIAWVWTHTVEEKRLTAPRGENKTGKMVAHETVISLRAFYNAGPVNDETIDQGFATIIDLILAVFRGQGVPLVTIPVEVTDDVTQVTSWIISIGEEMSVQQPFPTLTGEEGQGIIIRDADIILKITEQVNG